MEAGRLNLASTSMAERKVRQAAPWAKCAEIGRDRREIQRDIERFCTGETNQDILIKFTLHTACA
eukprot:2402485-Pleurochrysis_carterae.AAC.1